MSIWYGVTCFQIKPFHRSKQIILSSGRCCMGALIHWGWVTHICMGKLNVIGSDNGLSPSRRQSIIRTNAVILLIGPSGMNFSEILIEIHTFSFKKMHLKMSSGKWRPFCLGFNVLSSLSSGCNRKFNSGLILGLCPVKVTTSVIGWAQTLNQPCNSLWTWNIAKSLNHNTIVGFIYCNHETWRYWNHLPPAP